MEDLDARTSEEADNALNEREMDRFIMSGNHFAWVIQRLFVHIFLLTLLAVIKINADSNADLINSKVERTIDLTTNVVHILNVITIENKATSGSLKSYTFVVEPNQIDNVACVSAYLNSPKGNTGEDSEKRRLNVAVLTNDPKKYKYTP